MSRYWVARVAAFAAESPPRGALVFAGDSMTERFALARHLPASLGPFVNRGVGGDKVGGWRYRGLLDRIEASVIALAPRQAVLMIGVNDIVFAATPPALLDAAADELLRRLAAAAPLLVQSVLPARALLSVHNPAIARFNTQLAALAATHGAGWLDLRPAFTDAQGELRAEFASDSLHLNEAGYARWAAALAPRLRRP